MTGWLANAVAPRWLAGACQWRRGGCMVHGGMVAARAAALVLLFHDAAGIQHAS